MQPACGNKACCYFLLLVQNSAPEPTKLGGGAPSQSRGAELFTLPLVLPASTAKLANTDMEEKRLSHLNKSTRFAQRPQHPGGQQKFQSDVCVALLGVLVQQTLAADPCAVWDRLATGTRSLEGSVSANVASAPLERQSQMDRPLPKQSRCTEGRPTNSG